MTNEEFIQSIALPGEEWKLAQGCGERYVVSSFGRIAALSFPYYQGKYLCYRKQRIKKLKLSSQGYYMVNIILGERPRLYSVHRIVAEAFIPNPENLPCVNHKDEDKTNNRVDNLEWCTHQYNIRYGEQYRVRALKSKQDLKYRKPVVQLSSDGLFIATHRSVYQAEKKTGVPKSSIKRCIQGRYKTGGGFIWILASDYESQVSMSKNS